MDPIVDVQAKDRLTGAVILVVLLVLVIPELLSGPEHQVAAVAPQHSDEPPLRSYTVELGDEAHARHAPASDSASTPALNAAPSAPAATTAPAPASSPVTGAQTDAAAPRSVTAAPPAVVTAAPPAVVTAAPVVAPRAPTVRRAPAPPAAAPSPREPAKPTVVANSAPSQPAQEPSGSGWTVQLGSFASRANAERLVSELKAKGYAAFSTQSGGGGRVLYRVRVGPAGDHAAAAALAAKLRTAGHSGTLTQHP
jgi:DedD protein